MLTDGLTEGCPSDSVTATVHSQDSLKGVSGPQQAQQAQQQAGGDSAGAPMEVDADDAQLNDRCVFPERVDQVMSSHPPPPPPSSPPPNPPICPVPCCGVGSGDNFEGYHLCYAWGRSRFHWSDLPCKCLAPLELKSVYVTLINTISKFGTSLPLLVAAVVLSVSAVVVSKTLWVPFVVSLLFGQLCMLWLPCCVCFDCLLCMLWRPCCACFDCPAVHAAAARCACYACPAVHAVAALLCT